MAAVTQPLALEHVSPTGDPAMDRELGRLRARKHVRLAEVIERGYLAWCDGRRIK